MCLWFVHLLWNAVITGVDAPELQLGQNLKVNVNLRRQENKQSDITYLVEDILHFSLGVCEVFALMLVEVSVNLCFQILSRGQLVKHGRYQVKSEVLISLMFPITKDMLPSFRIIAYYHQTANEVVSDSVWVDVKDSCMGSVRHTTQMKCTTIHSHTS